MKANYENYKNYKNYKITVFAIIVSIIFSLTSFNTYASSSISTVTRLNLTSGKISGEKVDYIIFLPQLWSSFLSGYREKMGEDSVVIEKIVLNFTPQDKISKPVFLTNFYVCDRTKYNDTYGFTKILETDDYVFAISPTDTNNLINKSDKAIFARILSELNEDGYLAGYISIPKHQKIIYKNTIKVNGKMIKGKVIIKDGTTYIPLRAAAESMGYKIGWLQKEKATTISKGDFYEILFTKTTTKGNSFNVTLFDNASYLPSFYFVKKLNASVETDEFYNVSINY